MNSVIRWFEQRPLRLAGFFLVFVSVGLLVFMVLLDIIAGLENPYLGIITYMILPTITAIGLILVPLDSWLQRRRAARGEPVYPVIDLSNPFQRRIAIFFAGTSVLILVVLTVVTYKAIEFMDTTTFCGEVCHKIMRPEFTAYQRSPHASVSCIECHIGPGAPWFVRSKLSGAPQTYHYTVGDYPRPIESPVKALRPSRDTCENCHWPKEFYGSTLETDITYRTDRENTRVVTTMFMRVGSGGVPGSGIHSHMVGEIHYLPAVEKRTEIAWVRVKRADGSMQEFVNPVYRDDLDEIRKKEEVRLMDCIDCHNRAAHDFEPFEEVLDEAITRQEIDPTIPFIKREAIEAVGDIEHIPTEAEQAETVRRIEQVPKFYEEEFPEIYESRRRDVEISVEAIKTTYLETTFPHMRIGPDTYPNWRTHTGCFRCHGVLESASPGGRDPDISGECDLCHTQPIMGEPGELISGM
ncbi:MAG: NapC/NirT family cytochrome c [Armatimonadetes bacterium]|nr:NapC/NirT family cytochrome c [Armatimonadota bacterium]